RGRVRGALHGPERALESRLGQSLSLGALELIRGNERLARRQHREPENEDGKEGQRDHCQGQRRAPLITRDAKLLHRAVMRVMRDTALLSAASPEAATGRYATVTVIWRIWGEVIEPQPGGALHSTIRTWRECPAEGPARTGSSGNVLPSRATPLHASRRTSSRREVARKVAMES